MFLRTNYPLSAVYLLICYLPFITIMAFFNPGDDAVMLIEPGLPFLERTIASTRPENASHSFEANLGADLNILQGGSGSVVTRDLH